MDKRTRIVIQNRICEKISLLESQKKRQEKILRSLSTAPNADFMVNKAKNKLEEVNINLKTSREELIRFKNDPTPFIDEFNEEMRENSRKHYEQEKLKNSAKAKRCITDQKKKDQTYKKQRQERRSVNWQKKEPRIYAGKFFKAVDTLPDYMKKNLSNMSNNKCYKWRGVCFYGEKLPVKDEEIVCFDRSRQGNMLIHTYKDNKTHWQYTKKEKMGKKGKTEILETKSVRKTFGDLTENPPAGAIEIKYAPPGQRHNNHHHKNNKNNKKSRKVTGWTDSRSNSEGESKTQKTTQPKDIKRKSNKPNSAKPNKKYNKRNGKSKNNRKKRK
jgi:hypothetical protein